MGRRVSAVQQGPAQPDGAAEHPRDDAKMMADFAELLMEVCRALCCMAPSVMPGVNGVDGGSLMRGIPAGSVRLVYISELGQVS